MAKNSGNTRSSASRSTRNALGDNQALESVRGGTFSSWEAAAIREDEMNRSLEAFGERNGLSDAFGGGLSKTLGQDKNVRSYTITVDKEITSDANNTILSRTLGYRTQLSEYRAPLREGNEEYYRLIERADKIFPTAEMAYDYIESLVREINKKRVR